MAALSLWRCFKRAVNELREKQICTIVLCTSYSICCHSLEEVLCAGPEHELLVDLHVELGPLGLQLAPAGRRPWVRALH